MPTVLRWRGYKSVLQPDEGEPPPRHVRKGSGQAKFWLSDCRLAKARGFADHELRQAQRKIESEGTIAEGVA